jgi:hypothetical protein
MKEKLRIQIEILFANAPKTKKANELKEELLSNLNAKYDDLIARGVSEEDAFKTVIDGIGDVNELIQALERDNILNYASMQKERSRSAMFISVAVGLYIFSIAALILFATVMHSALGGELGVTVMFTIMAVATGLLVYNGVTRTKYRKADDTIVEEFKEWKSVSSEKKQLYKAISSIFWPLVVAFYFFISFFFGAWPYSWIIFIIGGAVQNMIRVIINYKE